MSLTQYRKKRTFSKTPEPEGGSNKGDQLRFVIQKHDASRLHYDFRLELKGVLKSWAVPKGPSLDPRQKRLAMMVEDHPYDYREFEGVIPKGQYGGGTVIVWDQGIYEPLDWEGGTRKEMEQHLSAQLRKGDLKIVLKGKKLRGAYALVRTNFQGENSWLLIKKKDRYASTADILKKEKSVLTGRTLAGVEKDEADNARDKPSEKPSGKTPTPVKKKKKTSPAPGKAKKKTEPIGKKARFPRDLSPMLASPAKKPFDEEGWVYEIKWDGYRALAYLQAGTVALRSRNNKSFDERFYPVYEALKTLDFDAVLDGEIVVVGKKGESRFSDLQNWRSEKDGELVYYAFDLLWYEGYSLLHLPHSDRREQLRRIIPSHPVVRLSESFATSGTKFFETARKLKLEGIMAKKSDSDYKPGYRTREWLKIKTGMREELVIGGYTVNEGRGKGFSSLLVGAYDKKKRLRYMGKVGTGFNARAQAELLKRFAPLERKTSPFVEAPDVNLPSRFRPDPPQAQVHWLRPSLVCEVSFTELTRDQYLRHPAFAGMREDKNAKDVVREF